MTLTGKCVTILAIIGSKQQLSVFPEMLESSAAVGEKRRGRSVGVALGDTSDLTTAKTVIMNTLKIRHMKKLTRVSMQNVMVSLEQLLRAHAETAN